MWIFFSIFLFHSIQVLVGFLFIIIASLNINRMKEQKSAIILNDIIVILIFLISIVNVIISAFGIENASQPLVLLRNERIEYP